MSDHFGNIPIQPTPPTPPSAPVVKEVKKTAPPPEPQPARRKRGKAASAKPNNRLVLWLGIVVLFFGFYNVLGFLGVPYYLAKTLPEGFAQETGMVFDPGRITFNPLTFRFATEQAKISTETGTVLLSLQSLTADLAPFSLLRLDMVCNTVTLNELDLNIARELDGSYNFDKVLRPKTAGGASEILNFSDLPFFFSLNNIAVKNSKVMFADLPTGKTHTIEKIQLELPTFSNIPFRTDLFLRPSFSAVINGSPVDLTGQARIGDAGEDVSNLTCNLHDLELPAYAEYLPLELPLSLTKGKADGKINLFFDPKAPHEEKLSLDFELRITNSELQSSDEAVMVTVPETQVNGKLKPMAKTVVLSSLTVKEPTIGATGSSFLGSINGIFKKDKKVAAADTAPAATPFSLAIDELLVDDGTFHLAKEKGAKKPVTWKKVQLSVKKYSSAAAGETKEDAGSFLLSGEKHGSTSAFSWQGDFAAAGSLGGTLKLDKIDFKELLLALGAERNLEVKGTAALQGHLAFSLTKEPASALTFKLTDADLTVQDFQLTDNKAAVISAPSLKIGSLATIYKTINFGQISLRDGAVLLPVARLPELFKQFTAGKYLLQALDFTGQITLIVDEKGKQKVIYPDIWLKASALDTPEKAKENLELTGKTPAGGSFQGAGDVRVSPFSLAIQTEFSGFSAEDLFPLMTRSPLLNSITGTVAGKGTFGLPRKSFAGDLQFAKAAVRRTPHTNFSWTDMVVHGVNYTSEPFHLGIATATLSQPQFSWQIGAKDQDPLQQLAAFFQHSIPAVIGEAQGDDKNHPATSPVDIQEIRFNQGSVFIEDTRLKPKWKADVTDFTGTIKAISLAAAPAASALSFTGKLQESPFTIQGEVNVFAKDPNGKIHLTLDGYPVSALHEQLAPQTDVDTKRGFLKLQRDDRWQDGQFLHTGSLEFSGVGPVSEKAESALTLALLNGPDGTFTLDFEFAGQQPAGKTVFIDEILSHFQTKVIKTSVSPLLIASGDFSDLIGNEAAEFEPGELALSDNGREVLSRYIALLEAHPHVGLELSGGTDRDIDGPAMKLQLEALETKRIAAENQKRYEVWRQEKALFDQQVAERQKKPAAKGKAAETNIPPAVLKDFIPLQARPIIVDDAMLLDLAKKRGQVVLQTLASQLALQPGRVTIAPPKKASNGQSGSVVKITLSAVK